jgi:hypothetical protein
MSVTIDRSKSALRVGEQLLPQQTIGEAGLTEQQLRGLYEPAAA